MKKKAVLMLMLGAIICSSIGFEVKSLTQQKDSWLAKTDVGYIRIGTEPKELFNKIKVLNTENSITIDSTDFFVNSDPKARIVIRIHKKLNAKDYAGKTVTSTVTCFADPAGEARVYVEGNADKHIYKSTLYQISADSKDYSTSMQIPEDIKSFWIRFDIFKPAIYTITDANLK